MDEFEFEVYEDTTYALIENVKNHREISQFPGYCSKQVKAAFFPILFLLNLGSTIAVCHRW